MVLDVFNELGCVARRRPRDIPVRHRTPGSLGVEENFYLAWPLVVRRLRESTLAGVLLAICVASLAGRLAFLAFGDPTYAAYTFTPCRLDSLAAGGLLSISWRKETWRRQLTAWLAPLAHASGYVWAAFAVAVYVLLRILDPAAFPHSVAARSIGFTVTAALSVILIASALIAPERAALSRFVRSRGARALGKYAYALYLYHVPIATLLRVSASTRRSYSDSPHCCSSRNSCMRESRLLSAMGWPRCRGVCSKRLR